MKKRIAIAMVWLLWIVAPVAAQSPSTAAIQISVLDQTGALVPGAKVTTVNVQTGAKREALTDAGGSATISALMLTGAYRVTVSKAGFATEDVPSLVLRAGETASLKIKLVASGGTSEVTVYGTAERVRSDAQIGQ